MRIEDTIDELVVANRILASQRVVDALGHVSVRSPLNPQRFLLSCAGQSGSLKTPIAMRVSAFQFDGHGCRRASPTVPRDSIPATKKRSIA